MLTTPSLRSTQLATFLFVYTIPISRPTNEPLILSRTFLAILFGFRTALATSWLYTCTFFYVCSSSLSSPFTIPQLNSSTTLPVYTNAPTIHKEHHHNPDRPLASESRFANTTKTASGSRVFCTTTHTLFTLLGSLDHFSQLST